MIYIYILFVPFIVFAITCVIVFAALTTRKNSIKKSQEEINEKANQAIKSANFNTTKIYYLNDFATYDQTERCKKIVFVDSGNKQIALVDYSTAGVTIIDFKDILDYEIYENGTTTTTGGAFGGMFAGIFNAEISGQCKDLKLIIRLNKIEKPHITYEIISNTAFNLGINKSSRPYRACITSLQEMVSFLEVIKKQNSLKNDEKIEKNSKQDKE